MTPKRQRLGDQLVASPDDVELKRVYADALLEEAASTRSAAS